MALLSSQSLSDDKQSDEITVVVVELHWITA